MELFALLGFGDQGFGFASDRAQAFEIGVADHRDDQP